MTRGPWYAPWGEVRLQLGGLLFGGMGTAIDAIRAGQSEGYRP